MMISYFGNVLVIFAYFFPLNPLGSSIYFGWLTLGYMLGLRRLPKVADTTEWIRIIRKQVQKLRKHPT